MDRTFLLLWNPRKWSWNDLAGAIDQIATAGICSDTWSVGNRSDLPVGSRIYLMRLGEDPKGIVGSGWSTSSPELALHWDASRAALGHKIPKITVEFDVLGEHPLVDLRELSDAPFNAVASWTPQSSGMELPAAIASSLHALWSSRTANAAANLLPHDPPPGLYSEGALRRITVNAYERDPRARKVCISHYGPVCQVCSFSFAGRYGAAFADFIHVHHVTPVSQVGQDYTIDPVKDLRPLCPNCHAAIHHRRIPYSIPELKELLASTQNSA